MSQRSLSRRRATALLFGSATFAAGVVRATAQSQPVRVLTFTSENAAEPFFANDMGYFREVGLDVTITTSPTDAATVSSVMGGAADIGYSTVGTIAAAYAKGVPVTVVAPASEYASPATRGLATIMLPATSKVRSAKDLNGKTVAVSGLGSIAVIEVRAWMDQNGGDSSTVKFVEIPLPAEVPILNAGRFDAALITEPFIGDAKKLGGRVLSYGYDSIAKRFILGTWFATRQWANAHPDVVRRYAAVMRKTASWANGNQDKTAEIVARYSKIDPAVIATMTRSHYGERLTPELMQPIIDSFARYTGFKPFPASDLLYTPNA